MIPVVMSARADFCALVVCCDWSIEGSGERSGNPTFTGPSPVGHRGWLQPADALAMGNERADQVVLGFIAVVTLYFLALVFAGATGGGRGLARVVVFGLGAAFGLEFLWTAWTALWDAGDRGSIGSIW